jgi:xanthine dehydrogenase accessory factor
MAGSVSGGCVEGTIVYEAQDVLSSGLSKLLEYGVVDEDGWEVGLACGGTIEVFVEPLTAIHMSLFPALRENEPVGLVTRLDGEGHLLSWPDGRFEGNEDLLSEIEWGPDPGVEPKAAQHTGPGGPIFVQVFASPPMLTIVGAVHLAQPLVRIAQEMGFWVRVIDGRSLFATRDRFPEADELIVAWPQEALGPRHLRSRDAVAVLTHDPKFDIPALEEALKSPVGYIGVLGSHTTQADRQEALRAKGFTEKDLARIHGPIGLDLGGGGPEEIALAIMAEIIAVRYAIPQEARSISKGEAGAEG